MMKMLPTERALEKKPNSYPQRSPLSILDYVNKKIKPKFYYKFLYLRSFDKINLDQIQRNE